MPGGMDESSVKGESVEPKKKPGYDYVVAVPDLSISEKWSVDKPDDVRTCSQVRELRGGEGVQTQQKVMGQASRETSKKKQTGVKRTQSGDTVEGLD